MDALEKKARKRVNRGAEYMDATYPNWYRRIDTPRLDLSRADRCILGQLYGNYWNAPETKMHSIRWLTRRGFCGGPNYGQITTVWRAAVAERLAESSLSADDTAAAQRLGSSDPVRCVYCPWPTMVDADKLSTHMDKAHGSVVNEPEIRYFGVGWD